MSGYIPIRCSCCSVVFALADRHYVNLRNSGATFYCPNGHTQSFGPSEADKLRKECAELQKRIGYRDTTIAHRDAALKRLQLQHRAAKGRITKLNRAAKGAA